MVCAYLVRYPPSSLSQAEVGGHMRQTTSDLFLYNIKLPYTKVTRIFKQIIWGAIWQLPLERNATDNSERMGRNERKNMIYM